MSANLENLQAMLVNLSPTELLQLTQALNAQVKTVSEQLSEAKKEFLASCCEALEGSEPPEACTIAISFDETGKIIERSYKAGAMKRIQTTSTGTGVKGDGVIIPETGSLCLRSHHGVQHKLFVRGSKDFVLDGKAEYNEMTPAWRSVIGKKVGEPGSSVSGPREWVTNGKVLPPSKVENGDIKPGVVV